MTARQKVEDLIEVFSNNNTRDSERKAYEHAIFHVAQILSVIDYNGGKKLLSDFYMDVLKILQDERN